jgi:ribosomal protein S18 acetylase RimI-like enzyme
VPRRRGPSFPCRRAYLGVLAGNDAALGLYRSVGFEEADGYCYLEREF